LVSERNGIIFYGDSFSLYVEDRKPFKIQSMAVQVETNGKGSLPDAWKVK
jgi:hypothetical protein